MSPGHALTWLPKVHQHLRHRLDEPLVNNIARPLTLQAGKISIEATWMSTATWWLQLK